MPKIFISYRREDSAYPAAVIRSRLVADFGQSEIFFDVDSIPPGHDFRVHIGQKVGACDYVIVVIGKAWLTACDEAGERRLDNPADFVRLEIEAALKRNIPVIPVLVDNAPMPKADQLPEHLSDLVYRHAHFVRPEPDLNHDLERLARRISEQEAERKERIEAEKRLQEERRRQETQKAEEEGLEREAAARTEKERLEEETRAAQAKIEEERERQEAEQKENERREHEAAIVAERQRFEREAQVRARAEHERLAAEKRAEEERQLEAKMLEQEHREKEAAERAEKARLEREARPALFASVAEREPLQREAAWLRRSLILGSVAIVATVAVLLAITLLQKPNGARFDDPSRTAKRPSESSASSEKSLATVSKTQPKPNDGARPSVPPEPRAEAPFKAVSPPPSTARADGQFDGSRAGQLRDVNGLKLVWIPPGEFTMGSPKDEKDRDDDETQVQVTLTKGFWLGQHEVTQSEWQRLVQTMPWSGKANVKEGDDYPATYVSWDDAIKFCEKLTETEQDAGRLPAGWKYTLPTETQWEYACRGGTRSRFSFGDDESDLTEYGWFDKNGGDAGEKYAHQVAQKKPNPWGLSDMHGNVWEWCRDWYAKELAGGMDPQGPSEGSYRALRGGSWRSTAGGCRSALRSGLTPDFRGSALGFRVAAVPSGK